MKSPTLAAILNFVTLGLGYVYAGEDVVVGLLMTVGAGGLLRYEELRSSPTFTGHLLPHWIVMFLGMGLLGAGVAIDVYKKVAAKERVLRAQLAA